MNEFVTVSVEPTEPNLKDLLKTAVAIIEDFLPNIGKCALQDYGRLNTFLIEVDKIIPRSKKCSAT